jgi:diadenosine tetraphosphate (Ap4A) HIT family hydrolase
MQKTLFKLNEKLEKDTFFVKDLVLSRLLLMDDTRFPWLILVPLKEKITEIYQLEPLDGLQLWNEIVKVTEISQHFFKATKMNVATLGNQVPQLHVHIIARKITDSAWPHSVWGSGDSCPYEKEKAVELIQNLREIFKDL